MPDDIILLYAYHVAQKILIFWSEAVKPYLNDYGDMEKYSFLFQLI